MPYIYVYGEATLVWYPLVPSWTPRKKRCREARPLFSHEIKKTPLLLFCSARDPLLGGLCRYLYHPFCLSLSLFVSSLFPSFFLSYLSLTPLLFSLLIYTPQPTPRLPFCLVPLHSSFSSSRAHPFSLTPSHFTYFTPSYVSPSVCVKSFLHSLVICPSTFFRLRCGILIIRRIFMSLTLLDSRISSLSANYDRKECWIDNLFWYFESRTRLNFVC